MSSVFVGSNLIDIYGKCGCIEDAGRAFHNNVVSWTAIINGYAFHCGGLLYNFKWICQEDIKINNVAFVIVILQSCGPSVSSPALLSFHGVQFTGFLQQWNTTPTYIVDLLGNATILQRMWSRQHPANNMWLRGWLALLGNPRTLCRVGNTSQKKLLNWTLDMRWALCCYQTLLPCWQLGSQWRCQTATRGVKGCEKILRLDLDWMEWWCAYICTRWSRPSSKRENRCLGRWMMLVQRQNLSSTVWMKKKNCHIGVSITTNWLLHLDLTAQLMVILYSTFSRIWRYYCGDCHAATKFIEKCSWECNYSMRIPVDTIISRMVFVQVGLVVTPAIPVLHR